MRHSPSSCGYRERASRTKCAGSIGAGCNDVTVRGGLGIDFIANF
jgi:hypothetical protein